jgi:hypothetical protein
VSEKQYMENIALRRKLDAFLVDNPELEALNSRLGGFNIFRVLRVERAEIRHSNVLAWLLNPNENHGLGDRFLRRFLSRLLMENESVQVSLSPASVELMEFGDTEVLREWNRIDIFVRSRRGNWCLLIENKVGSRESPTQLGRYRNLVSSEVPKDADVIPVFLTPEGGGPSEEGKTAGYVPLSYLQVLELVERLVTQARSNIPDDAQLFVDHYLEVLKRITMQDSELVQLCKTIYRKHREAIDLVVQYGASSQVLDACEDMVRKLPNLEFRLRTGNRVWFLPKEMAAAQQEVIPGFSFLSRQFPVMWWFSYRKKVGKVQLSMEVGPIEDADLRIRLLEGAKKVGFSFSRSALDRSKKAKYTRILSKVKELRKNDEGDPDDSPEYVETVASALWEKAWADGKKVVGALKGFDWDLAP